MAREVAAIRRGWAHEWWQALQEALQEARREARREAREGRREAREGRRRVRAKHLFHRTRGWVGRRQDEAAEALRRMC